MFKKNKVYILKIEDSSKNFHVFFQRRFDSLGVLLTYLINEYDILNRDIDFESFNISMCLVDEDDFDYKSDDSFNLFNLIPKL